MTLVRVAPNCAESMTALMVAGASIRLAGEVVSNSPLTHIRQQIHRIPCAPSLAERMHDAVAAPGARCGREAVHLRYDGAQDTH